MSSTAAFDRRAQVGFANAANYDANRPSYREESLKVLLENARLAGNKGATVIDLAAGTGKFTELLAEQSEGFKITAVEPHGDMRQVLANKGLRNVQVEDGLSTKIPAESESVDAVIAAQAFHWFANMESLREIHRVLQPHGTFSMIWNIEDYNAPKSHKPSTHWEQVMQDYVWSQDDDQPRFRHERWKSVFDEQIRSGPLALIIASEPLFALPLGGHEEPWVVWLAKDKVWDRLTTLSQIASLTEEEREKVHQLFMDAANSDKTEVDDQGRLPIHGSTYTHWTSKIPADGAPQLWEKSD